MQHLLIFCHQVVSKYKKDVICVGDQLVEILTKSAQLCEETSGVSEYVQGLDDLLSISKIATYKNNSIFQS